MLPSLFVGRRLLSESLSRWPSFGLNCRSCVSLSVNEKFNNYTLPFNLFNCNILFLIVVFLSESNKTRKFCFLLIKSLFWQNRQFSWTTMRASCAINWPFRKWNVMFESQMSLCFNNYTAIQIVIIIYLNHESHQSDKPLWKF